MHVVTFLTINQTCTNDLPPERGFDSRYQQKISEKWTWGIIPNFGTNFVKTCSGMVESHNIIYSYLFMLFLIFMVKGG